MIEYMLNGEPISVDPEDQDLFEKNNPDAKKKSKKNDEGQIDQQEPYQSRHLKNYILDGEPITVEAKDEKRFQENNPTAELAKNVNSKLALSNDDYKSLEGRTVFNFDAGDIDLWENNPDDFIAQHQEIFGSGDNAIYSFDKKKGTNIVNITHNDTGKSISVNTGIGPSAYDDMVKNATMTGFDDDGAFGYQEAMKNIKRIHGDVKTAEDKIRYQEKIINKESENLYNFLDETLTDKNRGQIKLNQEKLIDDYKYLQTYGQPLHISQKEKDDIKNKYSKKNNPDLFKYNKVKTGSRGHAFVTDENVYEDELKRAESWLKKNNPNQDPTQEEIEELARHLIVDGETKKLIDDKLNRYMNSNAVEDKDGMMNKIQIASELATFGDVKELTKYELKSKGLLNELKGSQEVQIVQDYLKLVSDPTSLFAIEEGEETVTLTNGKVVPKWRHEQYKQNLALAKAKYAEYDKWLDENNHIVENLKDSEYKNNLIQRNYNDMDKFLFNIESQFGQIINKAEYGVQKLVGEGILGLSETEYMQQLDNNFLNYQDMQRIYHEQFQKDIQFEDVKDSFTMGKYLAQLFGTQIPILATYAVPYAGVATVGFSGAGENWARVVREDRDTGSDTSTKKKFWQSLGYGAAEVIPDKFITLPLMKRAFKGVTGGRATMNPLLEGGFKEYNRKHFLKDIVYTPLAEIGSEGLTITTQNIITGRPWNENLNESLFGGGVFGALFGGAPYAVGLAMNTVSTDADIKKWRETNSAISDLELELLWAEEGGLDKNQKKDIQSRIDELKKEKAGLEQKQLDKVNNLDKKSWKGFLYHWTESQKLKMKAQEYNDDPHMDSKKKEKLIDDLHGRYSIHKKVLDLLRGDGFGNKFNAFVNSEEEEDKVRKEKLFQDAYNNLVGGDSRTKGRSIVSKPTSEQIKDEAQILYNLEEIRSDVARIRANGGFSKPFYSWSTVEKAIYEINKREDLTDSQKQTLIEGIENGNHGSNLKGWGFQVEENMAKDNRLETRTHEQGHAWLEEAIGREPAAFAGIAEQILDWAKNKNESLYYELLTRSDASIDGVIPKNKIDEVVVNFMEMVAENKFDLNKNKGLGALMGWMFEHATKEATNSDYDFDFAGETDAVNFIIQLAKKIKKGTVKVDGLAQSTIAKEARELGRKAEEDKRKAEEDKGKKKDDIKESAKYDAKIPVDDLAVDPKTGVNYTQEEWDRVGADRAIEEFKKKRKKFNNQGYLDGLIASKYKIKDVPQSFVDDVLGSPEFLNMINRFNRDKRGKVDENDSLFGYIQGQLRFRADDVFNKNEQGKAPKGTRTVDIDAKTPEGTPVVQPSDTDTRMEKFEEQDMTIRDNDVQDSTPEVKERKSKFRNEIGMKGIGKGKVFRETKKALRTAGPITNPKKFIKTYEETLAGALFDMMKQYFPDANTMIKYRMAILESIPISTLKKWQKELPAKDKDGNDFGNIFVKNHGRKSDQAFLHDFMYGKNKTGKNPRKRKLLPDLRKLYEAGDVARLDKKDAVKSLEGKEYYRRKAAGITLWERLPVSSTTWTSYVNGNFIGKRQEAAGSGTAGNNRTKILEASAIAIGKDAAPENLTTEFIKDYISENKLKGKMTVEEVRESIVEVIERPVDLKFSDKTDGNIFDISSRLEDVANLTPNNVLSKNGIDALALDYIKKVIGGKEREVIPFFEGKELSEIGKIFRQHLGGFLSEYPQYIPYFSTSMATGYRNSTFGAKDVLADVLDVAPGQTSIDMGMLGRFKFSEKGTKKLDPKKIRQLPNGEFEFKKKVIEKDGTAKNKWISSKEFFKDNKSRINTIGQLIIDAKNYVRRNPSAAPVFARFTRDASGSQNHFIKIMAPLIAIPIDKNGKIAYIKIREEHAFAQNLVSGMFLNEVISSVDNAQDVIKVIQKSYSQFALSLVPNKFSETGHDGMVDNAKLTATSPDIFWKEVVPRIINGDLDWLADGLANVVRYTQSGIDLNNYYLPNEGMTVTEYFGVGRYNNASQRLIDFQNNIIEKVLTGKISRKDAKVEMQKAKDLDAVIKPSKPIVKNILNSKKAKDNSIKYSKKGKVVGMSTFDFDETLIIDGENFVIATDPDTKQEIKISSGDWPTKGPELAAAGYEMNFDDFVNVRGGKEGPLLDKMRNQIKKYGANNVFILTARPQSADIAIHEWLKSKNINIPFKNITGLADSRGQAKADWMLEKFAEGYNDMYFVDDALQNVSAVKEVLDQLDIKSKVVQAKTKVKVGGFLVDVTTQEGRDFIKQYNSIVTVRSSDPDLANQKIKFSRKAERTADKLINKFNEQAERVRKDIKTLEDDLRSRGYTINPTSSSSEFKRIGGWIIDTRTKEGKEFIRDLENIPTVSSSEFGPGHYSVGGKVYKGKYPKGKLVSNDGGIKFSESSSVVFNEMLERVKGVKAGKVFSAAEARQVGKSKGKNLLKNFFVPPSAEDFKGLLYSFLGTGKEGDADFKFFKDKLLTPFAEGTRDWNRYRQNMSNEYAALKKQFPGIGKRLLKKAKGTPFTNDSAIRVYLWNKSGFNIPGLSSDQIQKLSNHVEGDSDLKMFAEGLSVLSRMSDGYIEPSNSWVAESIASDLSNIVSKVGRADFLQEWKENVDEIFSPENLNKIEAIYGKGFREALENILHRMETGKNRNTGSDRIVNGFLDWINGSVGAVMFMNIRSATLQTISTVNFINWADNNIFKAAAAFANQPQFWKDFAFIFNSDMLKQRRAGLQIDVSASELTKAFHDGRSKPQAILAWLLEKGFTPTQVADSFAIAMGGSTFYRNRLNTYLKQGMSEAKAKEKAWLDFQEIAEETQQSSRPDLISQQQAGALGRILLAWQNTPMQMTRLTKKALSDLINGRGDTKQNISRIIYYGVIQNLIFGALQTGLAFMMFGWDDDEEKKKKLEQRVANGALDTILRGTGIYGAMISTLKNTLMKWQEESKAGWKREDSNIIVEAINLSPPIGSKVRKLHQAIKTEKYNKGVSKEIGLRIENPNLSIAANWIETLTNAPVARLLNKTNNIEEALTGNHDLWQRVAILAGWSKWSVGVKDEELEAAKEEVKQNKKEQKEIEKEKKKEQKKKEREEEKKSSKVVRCSGIKSNGKRCSLTTAYSQREQIAFKGSGKKTWTCPHHSSFKDGQDRDKDGKKEYQCTGRTSSGKRCKNRGEYTGKVKRCYAHK